MIVKGHVNYGGVANLSHCRSPAPNGDRKGAPPSRDRWAAGGGATARRRPDVTARVNLLRWPRCSRERSMVGRQKGRRLDWTIWRTHSRSARGRGACWLPWYVYSIRVNIAGVACVVRVVCPLLLRSVAAPPGPHLFSSSAFRTCLAGRGGGGLRGLPGGPGGGGAPRAARRSPHLSLEPVPLPRAPFSFCSGRGGGGGGGGRAGARLPRLGCPPGLSSGFYTRVSPAPPLVFFLPPSLSFVC